jgi:hypothetical protein
MSILGGARGERGRPAAREIRREGYAAPAHRQEAGFTREGQFFTQCLAVARGGHWDPPKLRKEGPPWSEGVERKFVRLRNEWKAQRGHHASSAKLAMHPAYQKIIGMGPDVVPLLLRELASEREPDAWFWALRAITEANPVPDEARGDGRAMALAWLEWGKDQGYQW